MKERLITFICALGALALFFTMFMHQDSHGIGGTRRCRDPPRKSAGETAIRRRCAGWTRSTFARFPFRDRYDKLPQKKTLSASGNVLIVTLPATAVFKTEEFRPLDHWVRAGNTLLVLAALSDTPEWAFRIRRR